MSVSTPKHTKHIHNILVMFILGKSTVEVFCSIFRIEQYKKQQKGV